MRMIAVQESSHLANNMNNNVSKKFLERHELKVCFHIKLNRDNSTFFQHAERVKDCILLLQLGTAGITEAVIQPLPSLLQHNSALGKMKHAFG